MTEEERLTICNWVENDFKDELSPIITGKYHNEMKKDNKKIIPLIWEIRERIILREGLRFCEDKQFLGDFLAYIPKDGYIYNHRDKKEEEKEYNHSRFNVFIQLPKSMKTFYAGVEIDAIERCYLLSRSSVDWHYSEVNTTDTPRISLSFGFLLTNEKLDKLCRGMPYNSILSKRPMFNRGIILTESELVYIRELSINDKIDIHCSMIREISERLLSKEGILEYLDSSEISIVKLEYGQQIEKHTDECKNTVRFDIWIQYPESITTYYSEIPVKAIEGSYSLCRSGIDKNWCSFNESHIPLIKLSIKIVLPLEVIDKLTSNFNIDMYMNYPLA